MDKLLPDYRGPGGKVKVRNLLDHTSGLPNYTSDIDGLYPTLERNAWTRDDMVANFAPMPLQFEPGTLWNYTNSGYYLLGLIIEKTSGLDYYEYLRTHVFMPLGMHAHPQRRRCRNHSGPGPRLSHARWRSAQRSAVALPRAVLGGIAAFDRHRSSPDIAAVYSCRPAFPQSLRDLRRPDSAVERRHAQPVRAGRPDQFLVSRASQVSHSGEIFGFHSNHAYYPDEDLTIVVLTNRAGSVPVTGLARARLARILLDIPAPVH